MNTKSKSDSTLNKPKLVVNVKVNKTVTVNVYNKKYVILKRDAIIDSYQR